MKWRHVTQSCPPPTNLNPAPYAIETEVWDLGRPSLCGPVGGKKGRSSSAITMEPEQCPGWLSVPPSLPQPQPREEERKLQQEKLSGVVKSVHRRLRKKYREGNAGPVLQQQLLLTPLRVRPLPGTEEGEVGRRRLSEGAAVFGLSLFNPRRLARGLVVDKLDRQTPPFQFAPPSVSGCFFRLDANGRASLG